MCTPPLATFLLTALLAVIPPPTTIAAQASSVDAQVSHQAYAKGNWDIWVMNADGSGKVNARTNSSFILRIKNTLRCSVVSGPFDGFTRSYHRAPDNDCLESWEERK
jgi:hypothetical protein